MKQFFFLTALLWFASLTFGQPTPNQSSFAGIHYQTVVRNSEGLPMQNTAITLLLTIRANAPDGEAVYSETHTVITNPFGLVNLAIGQGTPVTGEFHAINWGAAPHFLETALDATGSGQYQIMGVTQFLSVPYALNSLNGMPAGNNPGDMLYWDGSQWLQIGAGQNGQVLTFSNGIPTWGGVQLPILITTAVTNITAFTAYSGGNIASDGGSPIVGRGICWNTSPNPTTSNFKVFAGSGAGSFLAQMTGLESSTQYFVRAFATNSAGTSYGQELSFYTTAGNITLSTTAITDITTSTAISGGNIVLNGGSPVTARGVCWNTAPYPTTAHYKTTDGSGNGTFVSQLTGLTNNTQYYVRAYATNSLGTSYGNQLTFTTLSGIVTLTTAGVTGITSNSAISGGEITSDGGSPVTARGVCWNTSPNPTTANSLTTDGEGTGIFVSNLTGLLEDTTYYVRAYATNAFGTWYGNEVSFETPAWECGNPLVDSRDGQIYSTVQIGTQCWMAENLNVGIRIDSTVEMLDNWIIEKYCYNDSIENCYKYGGLYMWNELMQYQTIANSQGICPEGWIVPSDNEWMILEGNCDSQYGIGDPIWQTTGFRGYDAGMHMKSTDGWFNNGNGDNVSGMNFLPNGKGAYPPLYSHIYLRSYLWTSTQSEAIVNEAIDRAIAYENNNIGKGSHEKHRAHALRCLKGNENLSNNLSPSTPFNEFPETGSDNLSIEICISWSCSDPDGDPLTYDVFFGTENQPAQLATAIADTFYTPGTLNYNTTYFWKIVAHDDQGNSTEGETWSFTTRSEEWLCGDVLFDERDGQEYNSVQIGDQCWMAENLNLGTRIIGSSYQTNNAIVEKYCYDNAESFCDIYGGLYQWDEMMQYSTTPGIRGICPVGWHLPANNEWTVLTNYVSSQGEYLCNSNTNYIAKALAATNNWYYSTSTCAIGNNFAANNATGFTGLPGGRTQNGSFLHLGSVGNWWSTTEYGSGYAFNRSMHYNTGSVAGTNTNDKTVGYSVRCVRD